MALANDSPTAGAAETPFLTAHWRHLVMLNYEVDAGVLAPFIPAGVELDVWQGKTLVSLVGFEFLNTRVLGLRIPGHEHFHEVKPALLRAAPGGGAARPSSVGLNEGERGPTSGRAAR